MKVTSLDLQVRCWCDIENGTYTEALPKNFVVVDNLGGGNYHYIYSWVCRECGENGDEGEYQM
jgi:hypothetical protein